MNMKRSTKGVALALLAGSLVCYSCGDNNAEPATETPAAATEATTNQPAAQGADIEEVTVTTPINAAWVKDGKGIYEMKCQSCHKLTDERLVGPGWKGVTQRRSPGWIVAMTTKPEVMVEKDPEAIKMVEELLVKMPNQNITKEEALKLLEFMRSNDGVK
jgi:cytochrome c551/c552